MVEDIEDLSTELHVEILRNSFNVIILEHGEIQGRQTRAINDIASGIATQIKAWQGRQPVCTVLSRILRVGDHNLVPLAVHQAWRHRIAVRIPEVKVRCGGNLETLSLNVFVDVPR